MSRLFLSIKKLKTTKDDIDFILCAVLNREHTPSIHMG